MVRLLITAGLFVGIIVWGLLSLGISIAHGQAIDTPAVIAQAAARHGVDPDVMLRIAWCESRFDPDAVSPWGDRGLFQFAPGTWPWVSRAAGYQGYSPHDAEANANTAAYLLSLGQWAHWRACW